MKHVFRHKLIWEIGRILVLPFTRFFLNYRPKRTKLPTPCLIVSNHCTDFDPILVGLTVRRQSYFVASDHIFHSRAGRFLVWAQAPIARMKGTTASDTALTCVRRLKKGHNVIIFPEGNRSFNGLTCSIVASTAKLARVSGASLVTHRFSGGYLTSPRWSGSSIRRGKMTGEIVHIYSPAELKSMTVDQIADAIRADIAEDAYATQSKWRTPYKGKRLAEHLERALYLCPKCRRFGTLHSADNTLTCSACGLTARYTPLGYLEGQNLPFSTVTDWDLWEAGLLPGLIRSSGDEPVFSDDNILLQEVDMDGEPVASLTGTLSAYSDRLELADKVFPYAEISGAGLTASQGMIFTAQDRHYTLSSPDVINMRKYLSAFHAVTAPEEILSI